MKKEEKWVIDPSHSEIAFKIRHLMISYVKGVFRDFKGTVTTKGEDFEDAKIEFSMDASSVDTGDKKRDEHLKSPEFFDSAMHKDITFVSTSFKKTSKPGIYKLIGDLTIKNVTKPVELEAEFGGIMKDPFGNEKAGFSLNGNINRKDWGLVWNAALEKGGVMVSEDLFIKSDLQLVKSSEPAKKTERAEEIESEMADV